MADIIDIKPILTGFNGDPAHTPMYAIPSVSMRVAEDLINATWNEAQVNKTAFTAKLTAAPGNGAPLGGLKVTTENAWFAARPSGTEDVYKIYAESFKGPEHLAQVQQAAREVVNSVIA